MEFYAIQNKFIIIITGSTFVSNWREIILLEFLWVIEVELQSQERLHPIHDGHGIIAQLITINDHHLCPPIKTTLAPSPKYPFLHNKPVWESNNPASVLNERRKSRDSSSGAWGHAELWARSHLPLWLGRTCAKWPLCPDAPACVDTTNMPFWQDWWGCTAVWHGVTVQMRAGEPGHCQSSWHSSRTEQCWRCSLPLGRSSCTLE